MHVGAFFQDLQDLINNLFRIESQTSAPIIISITIFLTGFFLNELVKGVSRVQTRSITKKIFFNSLENLTKNIDRQGKAYTKLYEIIRFRSAEEGGQYAVEHVEFYQIAVLKQMGYENIFKVFFLGLKNSIIGFCSVKKRVKAFNKIWACIENAKAWQERTNDQIEMITSFINDSNIKRQNALNQYFEFITPIIFETGKNKDLQTTKQGEYLLEVAKIKYKWEQLPFRTNPEILQKNFVLPIMDIDNKYKNELDIVVKSSALLSPASVNYGEMERLIISQKKLLYNRGRSFNHYSKLMRIAQGWLK